MTSLISLLKVIVPLFVIVGILSLFSKKKKSAYSYEKNDFMNAAERAFFFKLVDALPDYFVFPQVSLIELIKPADFASKSKILSMHVDFAVFDKELKKCCVVELDGKTHNNAKQRQKDADRDNFLAQAGINVLRYKPKQSVTAETLRENVSACFIDKPHLVKG